MKNLGVTVKSLHEIGQDYDPDLLSRNFRSGVSARICHIQAGFDVIRTAKMTAIDDALRKTNIAVIHGASGQGKSTLAYRYIYDCCPLAYEISSSNANNVDEIISTLSALVKDLRCKITFFMDVEPSNSEWIKVLAQFGESKYAQCIVAIRQEDLNQYRHTLDKSISYSEVGLELTKEEARDIYCQLSLVNKGLPPFTQAWEEAGIHGTMLEFMYHLTHGESLQARLAEQVSRISGSKRKLLAYIVIGNYLGGHIQMDRIEELDDIDMLEAEDILPHWIDEFYSLNEENCFTDVHPIRTKIVMNEIFHHNIKAKVRYGLELYQKVQVSRVDTYLIRLLMEGMTPDDLMQWSNEQSKLSPVHYYGICKALYWKGIQDYMYKHDALIGELKDKVGELWEFFLPINFTEINIPDNLGQLVRQLNSDFPDVSEIVNRFDPQNTIFSYLEKWLNDKTLILDVQNSNDWIKAGQLLYLLSQIGYNKIILEGNIEGLKNIELHDLSTILLGLKSIPLSNYVEEIEEIFVCELRRTFNIIRFERSDQELYVKSFIDYFSNNDNTEHKSYITERQNMKILDLCRRAFPNEKRYHAEIQNDILLGSFGDIPMVKNIEKVKFPLDEMREPRMILTNLYKRLYSPEDRMSYAENALRIRDGYANILFRIATSLEKWSENKNKFQGLQTAFIEAESLVRSSSLLIPCSEISEYGFTMSDEKLERLCGIQNQKKLHEFEQLHNLLTEYINNLQHFIRHSIKVIVGEKQYETKSVFCLYEAFDGLTKMQTIFRRLLSDFLTDIDIRSVEKKEFSNIKLLWVLWERYIKDQEIPLDSNLLLKRFDEKEHNFASNVIKQINSNITEQGAIGHAESYGNNIRLTYSYTDEETKDRDMDSCITAIRNVLSDSDNFSSERLILTNKYQKVLMNPVLSGYGRYSPNIDNHYSAISINALFGEANTDSDLKPFPDYDADVEMYKQNPRLMEYMSFFGHIMLANMCAVKLCSVCNEVEYDDEIGLKVIEDYAKLCQRKIKDDLCTFEKFNVLESLLIHSSHDAILNKAVLSLDRFKCEIIDLDNWWMQSSDLLNSMLELLENDWSIKTALVHADDVEKSIKV